jgi:hypothetical protein
VPTSHQRYVEVVGTNLERNVLRHHLGKGLVDAVAGKTSRKIWQAAT